VSSAQNHEPPSDTKKALIHRYLIASGRQADIDRGKFVERVAVIGQPVFAAAAEGGATIREAFDTAFAALREAYEPHRAVWQEEYESHLNWEYSEEELAQIVAFLESPAGQHHLEGSWRMNAYIGTNTEELVEKIVGEAVDAVKASQLNS